MSKGVMFVPAGEDQQLQLVDSWQLSLKFLTGLFGYVTSIGFLNLTLVINDIPTSRSFGFPLRVTHSTSRCSFNVFCLAQLIPFCRV